MKEQEESLASSPHSIILVSIVKLKEFIPSNANLTTDVCGWCFSCSFWMGEESLHGFWCTTKTYKLLQVVAVSWLKCYLTSLWSFWCME